MKKEFTLAVIIATALSLTGCATPPPTPSADHETGSLPGRDIAKAKQTPNRRLYVATTEGDVKGAVLTNN